MAKYVLGLGLTLSGQPIGTPDLLESSYLIFQHTPHAWGEGEAYAKRNAVLERMRSGAQLQLDTRLLFAGRRTIPACMVAASLLVFLLGARLVHPLAGLLASALLGTHRTAVQSYNLAHSDIVALLFSTAAAWATFAFVKRIREPDAPAGPALFLRAAGAGVLLALACGAKMNALVVFALAGAAVAMALFQRWRRDARGFAPAVAAGGTVAATALACFIAFNPAITSDPTGGLAATVTEHRATELIQARFMRDHLTTLPAKFAAVGQLTTKSTLALAAVAVVAFGLVLRSRHDGLRFLALWFLIGLLAVTLWIPFPIGRNVLPLVLPGVLLLGGAGGLGATWLWQRFRRPRAPVAWS